MQNKVPGWDCYEHTDKTIKKKKKEEEEEEKNSSQLSLMTCSIPNAIFLTVIQVIYSSNNKKNRLRA